MKQINNIQNHVKTKRRQKLKKLGNFGILILLIVNIMIWVNVFVDYNNSREIKQKMLEQIEETKNQQYEKECEELKAKQEAQRAIEEHENQTKKEKENTEIEKAQKETKQTAPNPSFSNQNYNIKNLKSQGVINFGGLKYTWYSSKVLYHKKTPEWILGSDGVYRTKEGYIVCARTDVAQGTIFETPFGKAQVLDAGCAYGIVDVYVCW